MKTVWDDLFDEDILSEFNAQLRAAQSVADKQAFGMVRQQNTEDFLKIMRKVRGKIDRIIKRVEELEEPKEEGQTGQADNKTKR